MPAPKLKEARLSQADLCVAYEQVVEVRERAQLFCITNAQVRNGVAGNVTNVRHTFTSFDIFLTHLLREQKGMVGFTKFCVCLHGEDVPCLKVATFGEENGHERQKSSYFCFFLGHGKDVPRMPSGAC